MKNAIALWNRIAVAFRKQDANAPTVLVPVEISANADAIASVATNQAIKALKIFSQGFSLIITMDEGMRTELLNFMMRILRGKHHMISRSSQGSHPNCTE